MAQALKARKSKVSEIQAPATPPPLRQQVLIHGDSITVTVSRVSGTPGAMRVTSQSLTDYSSVNVGERLEFRYNPQTHIVELIKFSKAK